MSSTPLVHDALVLSALAVSVFLLVVAAYAVGSFVLMRPYTTARALGISLRELARETLLSLVTQPFLPLYYLFGHRMEPFFVRPLPGTGPGAEGRPNVPVIFIHGYMQNRVGFLGLAYALARRGLGPLFGFNYPWFTSIASNAARLDRYVERVRKETKTSMVDLVCHSMGGLVAMEMMRADDKRRVRRCVTIATPHAGIVWRGPLIGIGTAALRRGSKLLETHAGYTMAVPTLSVFSSHDNIVHPKETSQLVKRGGRDIEIEGYGHLAILFSAAVADHVASFLTSEAPSDAIVRPENDDGRADQPRPRPIDERISGSGGVSAGLVGGYPEGGELGAGAGSEDGETLGEHGRHRV